jgi:hypothetical protein
MLRSFDCLDYTLDAPTVADMLNLAAHPDIRDQVNEHIFVFALSAALIQRQDSRSLRTPPIWEIFPGKFFGKTKCWIEFHLLIALYNDIMGYVTTETRVRSEAQTTVQQQLKQSSVTKPIIIDKK